MLTIERQAYCEVKTLKLQAAIRESNTLRLAAGGKAEKPEEKTQQSDTLRQRCSAPPSELPRPGEVHMEQLERQCGQLSAELGAANRERETMRAKIQRLQVGPRNPSAARGFREGQTSRGPSVQARSKTREKR
eukprot:SAG31_NODE_919_length_11010_cov_27.449821_5_plen_133_part_00